MSHSAVMANGRCVCDGRYGCGHSNPCGAPNAGTGHGPWCAECNPRRLADIARQLAEITTALAHGRTREGMPR